MVQSHLGIRPVSPVLLSFPFRARACLAGSDGHGDPAAPAVSPVGAAGLQPHPLPHLLPVPVLPLLHADGRQRREQRHGPRVSVSGPQHVALHAEGPAAVPLHPSAAGVGQP